MKRFITYILFLSLLGAPAKGSSLTYQAGAASCPAPTQTTPVWGRLVLTGNSVACYYALGTAAPKSWIAMGTRQAINFQNNPLLVGLFITAHSTSTLTTGTVDNFTISPTPTYRLQDGDIGSPPFMGAANLINGVWNLMGSGVDIWGTADQFNFQPWLVWGDCTVTCRVTSLSPGQTWQKIGIMIRDGYNSGSDNATFTTSLGAGNAFQCRTNFNVNADGATVPTLVAPAAAPNGAGTAVGVNPVGETTGIFTLRP